MSLCIQLSTFSPKYLDLWKILACWRSRHVVLNNDRSLSQSGCTVMIGVRWKPPRYPKRQYFCLFAECIQNHTRKCIQGFFLAIAPHWRGSKWSLALRRTVAGSLWAVPGSRSTLSLRLLVFISPSPHADSPIMTSESVVVRPPQLVLPGFISNWSGR